MLNGKTWELVSTEEIQEWRERGKTIVTCKNCGKSKIVPPSQKDRKHCGNVCRKIVISQRKSNCPDCGVKISDETAYRTSGGCLDKYCKDCRCKINAKNKTKWLATLDKPEPVYRRGEGRSRGKLDNWTADMLQNPHYFSDIFHVPATPENIAREAQRLGM